MHVRVCVDSVRIVMYCDQCTSYNISIRRTVDGSTSKFDNAESTCTGMVDVEYDCYTHPKKGQ